MLFFPSFVGLCISLITFFFLFDYFLCLALCSHLLQNTTVIGEKNGPNKEFSMHSRTCFLFFVGAFFWFVIEILFIIKIVGWKSDQIRVEVNFTLSTLSFIFSMKRRSKIFESAQRLWINARIRGNIRTAHILKQCYKWILVDWSKSIDEQKIPREIINFFLCSPSRQEVDDTSVWYYELIWHLIVFIKILCETGNRMWKILFE